MRCKKALRVIAPSSFSCKLGDRHQFEARDAKIFQIGQFIEDSLKGPFKGKGPDMTFIKDQFFLGYPLPVLIGPWESTRIDDGSGTFCPHWEETGDGIGPL